VFNDSHVLPELIKNGEGKTKSSRGYISIRKKDHPFAVNGYVKEHRLVMERHLGRYIFPDEHVHHIDGNKTNNDIKNLQLLSINEHMKLHGAEKSIKYKGQKKYNLEQVAELYSKGLSAREIELLMGISKSAVTSYMQEIGISRTELQANVKGGFNKGQRKYDSETIKNMYLSGMSIREIAKKLKAATRTINLYVMELGISRPSNWDKKKPQ